jgi:hypothetical protein
LWLLTPFLCALVFYITDAAQTIANIQPRSHSASSRHQSPTLRTRARMTATSVIEILIARESKTRKMHL